jgi:hypothetical protein
MQDAAPSLGATMAANMQTRATLESQGMTYEQRRKN